MYVVCPCFWMKRVCVGNLVRLIFRLGHLWVALSKVLFEYVAIGDCTLPRRGQDEPPRPINCSVQPNSQPCGYNPILFFHLARCIGACSSFEESVVEQEPSIAFRDEIGLICLG